MKKEFNHKTDNKLFFSQQFRTVSFLLADVNHFCLSVCLLDFFNRCSQSSSLHENDHQCLSPAKKENRTNLIKVSLFWKYISMANCNMQGKTFNFFHDLFLEMLHLLFFCCFVLLHAICFLLAGWIYFRVLIKRNMTKTTFDRCISEILTAIHLCKRACIYRK